MHACMHDAKLYNELTTEWKSETNQRAVNLRESDPADTTTVLCEETNTGAAAVILSSLSCVSLSWCRVHWCVSLSLSLSLSLA
jgi:hypothetical protein